MPNVGSFEKPILAFACVLPTLVTLVYFVWADGLPGSWQQSIYGVSKVVQFALPVVWVIGVCRDWPTWRWPDWPNVAVGIAFGAAVSGVILLAALAWLPTLELYPTLVAAARDKVTDLDLNSPWAFAALGLFYALAHSLLEEYYWRWFVFGRMRHHTSAVAAGVVSSLAFAAHHVVVLHRYLPTSPLWVVLASAGVAVGGGFWAYSYHRRGELWSAWWSHLLVDAAIFAAGFAMLFGE
jgi:membrane protease YdiL (CAAX protease family)